MPRKKKSPISGYKMLRKKNSYAMPKKKTSPIFILCNAQEKEHPRSSDYAMLRKKNIPNLQVGVNGTK
jgi:hypothetical protein